MWLTKLEQLADPKYGLTVKFESGWKRRGASGGQQMKSVQGALFHHDVAPRKGTYPLREMLRDGRKGLSGPLAHIGFDRDGVVHVIGAGKANHAGTGKVPGVVRNGGNTRLVGIEMTSAGTRPWDWTPAQLREMPKLGAALGDIFGYGPSQNWGHYEYSDGGKIDPAGLPGAMPGLRSRIAAVRFGGISGGGATVPRPSVPASSPPVSPVFADVDKTQAWLRDLGYDPGPIDGVYGSKTEAATRQAQTDLGITPADGRPGPATRALLEDAVSKIDDLSKKLDRALAFGEQNQFRLDRVAQMVLDAPVQIKGDGWEGKTATLRGVREWYAADMAAIKNLIRESQAATIKAIQEAAKGQGLTDAQVQQIATAAAEASARVSAENVAGQLEVAVRNED